MSPPGRLQAAVAEALLEPTQTLWERQYGQRRNARPLTARGYQAGEKDCGYRPPPDRPKTFFSISRWQRARNSAAVMWWGESGSSMSRS